MDQKPSLEFHSESPDLCTIYKEAQRFHIRTALSLLVIDRITLFLHFLHWAHLFFPVRPHTLEPGSTASLFLLCISLEERS